MALSPRLALSALARRLPAGTRTRVRTTLRRLDGLRPAGQVQGWNTPLVGTGQGLDLTASAPHDVVTPTQVSVVAGPRIRCALVTASIDAGGMDEVVAFLARRLPSHGIETAVLRATDTPSADGRAAGRLGRMLTDLGLEVVECDRDSARAWMSSWRPDVISGHGEPNWVAELADTIAVPATTTLHGMHSLFGVDWAEQARHSAKLARIISVSELCRQQYLAGDPAYDPQRILTIPNAVDEHRRVPFDRASVRNALGLTDEYLFVSLARHCLQKNTYGLIKAFGELAESEPTAHLVIAGRVDDARYYRQVLKLRNSLPCGDRIHLRDHIADPARLLAAADGFVLDAFFEGWAIAPMEALFAGVPVIISDVGGAREQIDGLRSRGVVVTNPLGDPLAANWETISQARYAEQVNRHELVEAMKRFIASRAAFEINRGELAAESALRFDADKCLAAHAAVLYELADVPA